MGYPNNNHQPCNCRRGRELKIALDIESQNYYWDDPEENEEERPRRKIGAIFLSILLLVGTSFFVKTTLAANIKLNTLGQVEFGQGQQQQTSCTNGSYLTLTPAGSFSNSSGAGQFMFKSLTVSNIPVGCYGNDFQINAFDSTISTALALFNTSSVNATILNNYGNFSAGSGLSGITVTKNSGTSFTVSFDTPVATTSSVAKITIQSAIHTYAIGEIGPGGGMVFYYSAAGFDEIGTSCSPNCHYLEVAPFNWSGSGNHFVLPWAVSAYRSTSVPTFNGYNATGTAIGRGYTNSLAIVNQNGAYNASTNPYAAGAVRAYAGGGKNDWFLASKDELTAMNAERGRLLSGNYITGDYYYASTEIDASNSMLTTMAGASSGNGSFTKAGGGTSYSVPIRAF